MTWNGRRDYEHFHYGLGVRNEYARVKLNHGWNRVFAVVDKAPDAWGCGIAFVEEQNKSHGNGGFDPIKFENLPFSADPPWYIDRCQFDLGGYYGWRFRILLQHCAMVPVHRRTVPGFPVKLLKMNVQGIGSQLEKMWSDERDPHLIDPYKDSMTIHQWQGFSPMLIEGLAQLTLGGPMHVYHGGLHHARVRYYDAAAKRPGLPGHVGALVKQLRDDSEPFNW